MSKHCLSDFALAGGTPLFAEKLFVGRPNIGDREQLMARWNDILDRRWFSNNGHYVQAFESTMKQLLGVKHCIPICNGTVAIEILARALNLTGEVIVPSFTFVATAHALQWLGLTPVFCDLDPETHNLDPRKVEALITPRTSAIMSVHVWGNPSAINELTEIARKHQLKLMFDAAHAFGNTYQGQFIGHFGEAEIFSFHATKFVNSLEGGAIATNNDELAEKIRRINNFGFVEFDQVVHLGINGKMNEVSGAMGLTSLESMPEIIEVNQRNYHAYQRYLNALPGLKVFSFNEREKCNYQYLIVEVDEQQTGLNRDQLVRFLHSENIVARRYFYPGCHQMEPYKTLNPASGEHLPQTEWLTQRVMSLPTGTAVGLAEIEQIAQLLQAALQQADTLRPLLS